MFGYQQGEVGVLRVHGGVLVAVAVDGDDAVGVFVDHRAPGVHAERAHLVLILLGLIDDLALIELIGDGGEHLGGQLHPHTDVDLVVGHGQAQLTALLGKPLCPGPAGGGDEELGQILVPVRCLQAVPPLCLADGGDGGVELANKVVKTLETKKSEYHPLYPLEMALKDKITTIAKEIYGADGVVFQPAANRALKKLTELGFGELPVCMAKNQYSLSDDAKKLGRPENFKITVRDVYVSAGAGFVVVLTGDVMTMPGLPKAPAAFNIDVDDDGHITGLF